jgi:PAS domain S-box-containing protein
LRDLARPPEPELVSAWNAALGEALRRERQIQLSERFMATVLTQAPDPIFALNGHGEIVSSNDAAFRLFLNNPRALVGQHASGLFAQSAQADVRAVFERAAKGEVIERYVTRIAVNADNLRDAAIGVSAVRESGSAIVGYSMTIRDITELREAERRLAGARRELAHVARRTLVAAMSASIAHEVRQPVSAIVACAEAALRWLDRDKPDIAEARDALNQILEDAHRTNEIVTNIRSMFQHDEPTTGPVDMNEVVREVLALLQGELDRHSVTIRLELQQRLASIPGERVPLQQVLINVIMNAVDAMAALPRGSACLEVRTKSHVNRTVLVSVTDNGSGIDPALATQVFEPFYTTKSQGMGMGLYICKTIVEGHGGRLWAAPAIPRGTTFQIELSTQAEKSL